MEPKVILFKILIIFCRCTLHSLSTENEKPTYKCTISSGTTCTFRNILLNSSHFEWDPTADDPSIVEIVSFVDCRIPVVTKNICETFLNIDNFYMPGQAVEKIVSDALNKCLKMKILNLNSNFIEELHPDTFVSNKNLESLILWGNRIKHLNDHDIFINLRSLMYLDLEHNNMTVFSPELIRNNTNLLAIWLSSNDLSDIDAEEIVNMLPDLEGFYLNGNEIACTRLVDIYKMFEKENIRFLRTLSFKHRYYPQEKIYGNLSCNPDISWMASHYRKQQLTGETIIKECRQLFNEITSDEIINQEILDTIDESVSKLVHEVDEKFIEVTDRLDKLTDEIQILTEFVLNTISSA